ncbi:hypothetical protein ColKHC_14297 [Colletotrichum higginsianum]|nr:hypothetical protein ColKHC_14297 [Colletotrichum higginsianum]
MILNRLVDLTIRLRELDVPAGDGQDGAVDRVARGIVRKEALAERKRFLQLIKMTLDIRSGCSGGSGLDNSCAFWWFEL